jgi:hypothetical protein
LRNPSICFMAAILSPVSSAVNPKTETTIIVGSEIDCGSSGESNLAWRSRIVFWKWKCVSGLWDFLWHKSRYDSTENSVQWRYIGSIRSIVVHELDRGSTWKQISGGYKASFRGDKANTVR